MLIPLDLFNNHWLLASPECSFQLLDDWETQAILIWSRRHMYSNGKIAFLIGAQR